jgi:ribosome-associated protein
MKAKERIQPEERIKLIIDALHDAKGFDIVTLDVRSLSTFTDYMVIVNGNSTRHVITLAEKVVEKLGQHGIKSVGVEGLDTAEWVLIDAGDVVVHVMRPQVRDFYNLEKLWGDGARTEATAN